MVPGKGYTNPSGQISDSSFQSSVVIARSQGVRFTTFSHSFMNDPAACKLSAGFPFSVSTTKELAIELAGGQIIG